MISRRTLLSLAGATLAPAGQLKYQLIAHRGGIVDETHPEDSPGSIRAAIERGYWMIEVDIRRTRDGEPILQHDPDFRRFYGDPRRVEHVTWAEVSRLRAQPGGAAPLHFNELCQLCKGKIRLMLDIKVTDAPAAFYQQLARQLSDSDLLDSAYLLGGRRRENAALWSRCRTSANTELLRDAIARREDVRSRYFLLELASDVTPETVSLCQEAEVVALGAINTFRYTMAKRDEWVGAKEDAARLTALGMTHYQIDSCYESLFSQPVA